MDLDKLISLRKYLHQHPEVSGQEIRTSQYLQAYLSKLPHAQRIPLADSGFAVQFTGDKQGAHTLIRCELDALPIQEINSFEHASVHKNVSHKCGHDGHMTILCGLAEQLANQPITSGIVTLLFQPAEETGKGAASIIHDESFRQLPPPDFAFALHNIPKIPLGKALVKEGTFTASVRSCSIRFKGKTTHAAAPEHGINPAMALSELTQYTHALNQPDILHDDFQLITPIYMQLGEPSYGIAAGEGEAHFTIRTWTNHQMEQLVATLEEYVQTLSIKHHLQVDHEWFEVFHANENHAEAVALVTSAMHALEVEEEVMTSPFKFGEDFGLFTQKYKGAMFGLGAGLDCPELHNPDYDFPDELIPTGVALFETIIRNLNMH